MNKKDIIMNLNRKHEMERYTAGIACKVLDKVNGFELNLRNCTPYTTCAFLCFDSDDLLLFEERLSELTNALGKVSWKKVVTQDCVCYQTDYSTPEEQKIDIFISIYVKTGPYCSIIKIPTGKMQQIRQTVEEVPEYEYRVDCGKNLKDEEEHVKTSERFKDLNYFINLQEAE